MGGGLSFLGDRQTGLVPGGNAAAEIEYLGETRLAQCPAGRSRAVATGAIDDDRPRLELLQLGQALSNWENGMWRELGMWPPPYAAASRTSTMTASSRLIMSVACMGDTPAPPLNACQVCQSSMPPLNTARPTQGRLSLMNASNGCSVYFFGWGTPQKTSRISTMSCRVRWSPTR